MKPRIINLDGIKIHTLEAGKGKPMIFHLDFVFNFYLKFFLA